MLTQMLAIFIGDRKTGRLFQSRRGTPLAHGNIRNRVLHPLLKRLGIPKAGLHAFRHARVTILRKNGTPQDLQKQWIGHSSLRTGDRYSHTHEELNFRKNAAAGVGLDRVLGPDGPNKAAVSAATKTPLKASA
jgi:integrase